MAATGYTPIYLYYSGTPTNIPLAANLGAGELAINAADGNLFYKNTSNAVVTIPVLQSSATQSGWLSSTDWSTFNSKQPAGTYVTSVSGTAPVVSSGGTTPAISMAAATSSVNGYLTSADWTTFNGKQAALSSGVNIKTVSGTSLLGSGDVGTIGTGYGGTGLTSFTANGVVYASSTSALTTGSGLQFDGTKLYVNYSANAQAAINVANATDAANASSAVFIDAAGKTGTFVVFPASFSTYQQFQANATLLQSNTGDLNLSAYSTNNVKIYTNDTQRVNIASGGDVTVSTGNLVIGTSGKGIDFSATAGTGTSELLADYEEGTWDAVISDGTNNATMSNTTCRYTKIGRVVTLTGRITTTSLGSVTGGITITGLPYTIGAFSSSMFGYGSNFAITAGQSVGCYGFSGTSVYLSVWTATTGITAMTATQWGNTGDLVFNFTYSV